MIDLALALQLRDAGLVWHPEPGDRFVVTAPEMVDELFHLADMVIEPRQLETGTVFAFNGTTEWALDSVAQDKTVWLPSEGQLRQSLGKAFGSLVRMGASNEFEVTAEIGSARQTFTEHDPENAYGRALLALLRNR